MGSKAAALGAPSQKLKLQKSDLSMSAQSPADVSDIAQNQPLSDSLLQVLFSKLELHAPILLLYHWYKPK